MEFRDDLSDQVTAKTFNGNIITKNLGENVTLNTHNGDIIAGSVAICLLKVTTERLK